MHSIREHHTSYTDAYKALLCCCSVCLKLRVVRVPRSLQPHKVLGAFVFPSCRFCSCILRGSEAPSKHSRVSGWVLFSAFSTPALALGWGVQGSRLGPHFGIQGFPHPLQMSLVCARGSRGSIVSGMRVLEWGWGV